MDRQAALNRMEDEKQNAINEIEALIMRLESAKRRLTNEWAINASGIVQGAAAQVDTACVRYEVWREIASKLS